MPEQRIAPDVLQQAMQRLRDGETFDRVRRDLQIDTIRLRHQLRKTFPEYRAVMRSHQQRAGLQQKGPVCPHCHGTGYLHPTRLASDVSPTVTTAGPTSTARQRAQTVSSNDEAPARATVVPRSIAKKRPHLFQMHAPSKVSTSPTIDEYTVKHPLRRWAAFNAEEQATLQAKLRQWTQHSTTAHG